MASASKVEKPLFRDLAADDPDPEATEIESLCMNCGDNGVTRLLLTRIPFYKEVILMSFDCEKCGFHNNEIQSGGKIAEKGVRVVLTVRTRRDLNRQIVKSDYASIKIPELDFEIPSQSQKGEVTTIEGVIDRAIRALQQDQPGRKEANSQTAGPIDHFIQRLGQLKLLEQPFTLVVEDISGNSFVENPNAPLKDAGTRTTLFTRSQEQDQTLGIYKGLQTPVEGEFTLEQLQGEVLQFPTNCPDCGAPCDTNVKLINVPHFKDVLIMATNCESCGHRTNEVKSGGGIESKGCRIEVKVAGVEDFSRDVLKSETCSLQIPELDLEVGPAALGGRFTTVEGILSAVRDQLRDKGSLFHDGADPSTQSRFTTFLGELGEVLQGSRTVTLVLDDPAGNSYVQNLNEPEPDANLTIIYYERTFDHNEELGLNDMKTEGYEQL